MAQNPLRPPQGNCEVPQPLLDVRNVEVVYHGVVLAVKGVSLKVGEGQVVTLFGPNGAGKTSLLRAISGVLRSVEGEIRVGAITFGGEPIASMPAHRISRSGLYHIPEGGNVIKELTVKENLLLSRFCRTDTNEFDADYAAVIEYFPILKKRERQVGGYLSGGEQQMLSIAKALLGRPRLLVLDEPTLGLSPLLVSENFASLRQLNQRFGMATLCATQHENVLVPSESFPFNTVPQTDPVTRRTGDLLASPRASGQAPKIFFTQTSTEYWTRGASLLHTDVDGKRDVSLDPRARLYVVAGAQHLGGGSTDRGNYQNPCNPLNDRPYVLRALLVALDDWVSRDVPPPESRYPRIADGTLVSLEAFRASFPAIPGVPLPAACYTPLRLDFGPRWEQDGIADIVPPKIGRPYRTLVPAVDRDGNEQAGIRLPDVAVPLATYTGWNLRAAPHGAEEIGRASCRERV